MSLRASEVSRPRGLSNPNSTCWANSLTQVLTAAGQPGGLGFDALKQLLPTLLPGPADPHETLLTLIDQYPERYRQLVGRSSWVSQCSRCGAQVQRTEVMNCVSVYPGGSLVSAIESTSAGRCDAAECGAITVVRTSADTLPAVPTFHIPAGGVRIRQDEIDRLHGCVLRMGGHYSAIIKSDERDSWWLCDDLLVRPLSNNEAKVLVEHNAYLLALTSTPTSISTS